MIPTMVSLIFPTVTISWNRLLSKNIRVMAMLPRSKAIALERRWRRVKFEPVGQYTIDNHVLQSSKDRHTLFSMRASNVYNSCRPDG